MKLRLVLAQHQKFSHAQALKKNLGDAFLIQHNPVFRVIRAEAIRRGFRFSPNRFHDYDALALTQLPKILNTKTIPYCDNVTALQDVEKRAPKAFNLGEVPPLRANYVLHETAHGVARVLREKHVGKLPGKKGLGTLKSQQELALAILVEESFANACESFSNLYATNALHDEFLYKNSYIMEKPTERAHLVNCVKLIGEALTFQLLFYSFLYSNFLKTNTALEDFNLVLTQLFFNSPAKMGKLKKTDLRTLKKTFQIGLDLDPQFTIFTNAFCLRLMGIKKDLFEVLSFDFMGTMGKSVAYQNLIQEYSRLFSSPSR
jgi:hypothetical protein